MRGPSGTRRIHDAFLEVARTQPSAIALSHASGTLSYRDLERASRNLARQLRATAATGNAPVAIYGRRTPGLVVAMLACTRAGLAFAVLDAGYPMQRIAQLIDSASPGLLVLLDPTPEDERKLAGMGEAATVLRVRPSDLVDGDAGADAEIDCGSADAIAYLLFTSGTTGTPKCIETTHHPLVHFVDWYAQAFDAQADCRFSMLSGLGHDPVLRDIFVPLSIGAQLQIPDAEATTNPDLLYGWLRAARVTHAHVTPQLCKIACAGRRASPPLADLRFVCSGGDALFRSLAREVNALAPRASLVNFYGATETPQAMGYHVFDDADPQDPVPIGKGTGDVQLLVLDERLELAAVGVSGQVAVRTRFLSAGYRGDSAQTERKFVPNPAGGAADDRCYLTGDYGHFRSDGSVVVSGRLDDQVKIRGYRVELAEIVRRLEGHAAVASAAVIAERASNDEKRLIAYVVAADRARAANADGQTALGAELKAALAQQLPAYMVPNVYVWLEAMPLLPNGKLDRSRLPNAPARVADAEPGLGGANALERTLIAQWTALLGVPTIGRDDSFVALGGDSLSFIQASSKLEALIGRLPERWEQLPIRELAATEPAGERRTTQLPTSVLLRGLAIVAIVMSHFGAGDFRGSTLALFVLSGLSFARYQLNAVLARESAMPVWRSAFKIALPTILYTLLLELRYTSPKWQAVLLVSNYFGPTFDSGTTFWFIEVLVQSQLLLGALLATHALRDVVRRDPFRFGLAASAMFALAGFVVPHFWNTEALYDRVPHIALGLMFPGWALAFASTRSSKLAVLGAAAAVSAARLASGHTDGWVPLATILLLCWKPQVSLPIWIGHLVRPIASASLFIYLTHFQAAALLHKLPFDFPVTIDIALAVIAGVVAWKAWESLVAVVVRFMRGRTRPAPAFGA